MGERSVFHNLHIARWRFGLVFDPKGVFHGCVGRFRAKVEELFAVFAEQRALGFVVAVFGRARTARQFVRELYVRVAFPGFEQAFFHFHNGLRAFPAGCVIAAFALAAHERHVVGPVGDKGCDQRFFHASQTFHAHDLFRIVKPGRRIEQLPACDAGVSRCGAHCGNRAVFQVGIGGVVRLERARGTYGRARSASNAFFGRNRELFAIVVNASRCARLRAAQTVGVAIAHQDATLLMHGDEWAFELRNKAQHGRDARHGGSPLARQSGALFNVFPVRPHHRGRFIRQIIESILFPV